MIAYLNRYPRLTAFIAQVAVSPFLLSKGGSATGFAVMMVVVVFSQLWAIEVGEKQLLQKKLLQLQADGSKKTYLRPRYSSKIEILVTRVKDQSDANVNLSFRVGKDSKAVPLMVVKVDEFVDGRYTGFAECVVTGEKSAVGYVQMLAEAANSYQKSVEKAGE